MPSQSEPNPRTVHLRRGPGAPSQTLLTRCYLTFIILGGDVEKTAIACEVDAEFIERHAVKEDWRARIEHVSSICSPQTRGPAEIERLINRAALYVQAQRIRRIIDSVVSEIECRLDEPDKFDNILDLFMVTNEAGAKRLDLKPLVDVTQAALKLSQVCLSAMCDTPTERARRVKQDAAAGDDSLALGAATLKGLSRLPAHAGDSEELAIAAVTRGREALDSEGPTS